MKLAYLILAHANPHHFKRLIRALETPDCAFFVHIDAKSEQSDFLMPKIENLYFQKERQPIYWGEFSIVEATLELLKTAVSHQPSQFDYFILLSGVDFPLYHKQMIHRFFAQHQGQEFIGVYPMDGGKTSKPLLRLHRFVPRSDHISDPRALRKLRNKGIFAMRDYKAGLEGLTPFCGTAWWALSRPACQYILEFVERKPSVVHFFENTLIPDEMFFQTILANSPFKNKASRCLSYNDWTVGGAHPAMITEKHVALFGTAQFAHREILFARKFDDDSQAITEAIEAQAQEKGGGG